MTQRASLVHDIGLTTTRIELHRAKQSDEEDRATGRRLSRGCQWAVMPSVRRRYDRLGFANTRGDHPRKYLHRLETRKVTSVYSLQFA